MYTVSFKFFDDKSIQVEIAADELDAFIECIGSNKVFYSKEKAKGFWIHAEHVRCMRIDKQQEE